MAGLTVRPSAATDNNEDGSPPPPITVDPSVDISGAMNSAFSDMAATCRPYAGECFLNEAEDACHADIEVYCSFDADSSTCVVTAEDTCTAVTDLDDDAACVAAECVYTGSVGEIADIPAAETQVIEVDCAGTPGGYLTIDACEVCDDDYSNDNSTCADCNGTPNGEAVADNCGACDTDAENDCELGCDGEWGSLVVNDLCGVCSGNNTCVDCAGVPNGQSRVDMCDTCDDDVDNDCEMDCLGQYGGSAERDQCEVCGGDNSTCSDCAGTVNGNATMDNCDTCDADAANDCVIDCAGNWGGAWTNMECGTPDGGTLTMCRESDCPDVDCNGDWGEFNTCSSCGDSVGLYSQAFTVSVPTYGEGAVCDEIGTLQHRDCQGGDCAALTAGHARMLIELEQELVPLMPSDSDVFSGFSNEVITAIASIRCALHSFR